MEFLPNHIQDQLREIIEQNGIKEWKVHDPKGTLKGDGYIGVIHEVRVEGKKGKSEEIILNLIVKVAPTSTKLRDILPIRGSFLSEGIFYEKVFPTFRNLQRSLRIEEPFENVPQFFGSSTTEGKEVIFLENLKELGFTLWEKNLPMNEAHLRLVMGIYGKLHAVSHALKLRNPGKFQEIRNLASNGVFLDFFKESRGFYFRNFKEMSRRFPEFYEDIEKVGEGVMEFLFGDAVNIDEDSVFLHGDCWSNNMLFKYEEGLPSEMSLIDWQASRLGNPVMDLAYFFYSSCPTTFLDHWMDYLKVYHQSLGRHLKKFDLEAEVVYPFEKFLNHWKKYGKFGLYVGFISIRIMICERDEAPNFEEVKNNGGKPFEGFIFDTVHIEEFWSRIYGIFRHLLENNLL